MLSPTSSTGAGKEIQVTSSLTGTPLRKSRKSYLCGSQTHLNWAPEIYNTSLAHSGHSLAEKVPTGGENRNRGETLKRPSSHIKLWVSAVHKAFASTASRKMLFKAGTSCFLTSRGMPQTHRPCKEQGTGVWNTGPCPHTPARAWILHKSTSTSETWHCSEIRTRVGASK